MPVSLNEVTAAAASFTIVFMAGPTGPLPQVLLRRRAAGSTPFIGHDGRWHASWLPPRLAAFPFDLLMMPVGGHALALHEDSVFGPENPAEFQIFADVAGKPPTLAPEVAKIAAVLKTHAEALADTTRAAAALVGLDLLTPLNAEDDGTILVIDPEAVRALDEAGVVLLHRAGALGLVYAALVSREHLSWMAKAEQVEATSAAPRSKHGCKAQNQSRQADFLSALAAAQAMDHDTFYTAGLTLQ